MNSFDECEFASRLFRHHETSRTSKTHGANKDSSYTTHKETRPVVPPEYIQNLRLVRQLGGGLEGYFHTQSAGTFHRLIDPETRHKMLGPIDRACVHRWPPSLPRPQAHQRELPTDSELAESVTSTASVTPPARRDTAPADSIRSAVEPDRLLSRRPRHLKHLDV